MRERLRKLKENKGGFTLVELIVVLVILAILAGMLIPSLTGYIDKAHEKTALLECRQAVLAAQVKASEEYGKGNTTVVFDLTEIKELSEVPGTVNTVTAVDGKVTYLKYTSKRGIVVIYENGEYRIEGKTEGGGESGDGTGGGDIEGDGDIDDGGNNSSGTADFEIVGQVFSGIDAQKYFEENRGNGENQVLLPAGAYKVGNEYYYLINGTSYNGTTQSFQGHGVKINLNDAPKLFVHGNGDVNINSVYVYEGKYYVALPGATIWENPSSSSGCWGEIFPK